MATHAHVDASALVPLLDGTVNQMTPGRMMHHEMVDSSSISQDLDPDADGSPPQDDGDIDQMPKRRRSMRGPGTRSVANMTPEQLTRKRAMDRHAQRAIRERTRAQIERLEGRVQELEAMQPYQDMQRALHALKAVQAENAELRNRVAGVMALLQPLMNDASGMSSSPDISSVPITAMASSAAQAAVATMLVGAGNGILQPAPSASPSNNLVLDPSWGIPSRPFDSLAAASAGVPGQILR